MQAVHDYARRNRKLYVWEGTPKFAERQRRLSPDQYEIADVRHSQGIRRLMLFPKTILKGEWEADAPLREALGIKPPSEKKRRKD